MTTTVTVQAHCGSDTEVVFAKTTKDGDLTSLTDVTVMNDGETADKHVYDDQVAVVMERKKES